MDFKLEKALADWKRELLARPGFDPDGRLGEGPCVACNSTGAIAADNRQKAAVGFFEQARDRCLAQGRA